MEPSKKAGSRLKKNKTIRFRRIPNKFGLGRLGSVGSESSDVAQSIPNALFSLASCSEAITVLECLYINVSFFVLPVLEVL
jgi:hypothetical protein